MGLVSSGKSYSWILTFPDFVKLQEDDKDWFWMRFRVWQKKLKDSEGIFRNFNQRWKTRYCSDEVLYNSTILHLPCDVMMCRIAILTYPACRIINSHSSPSLRIDVTNYQYNVDRLRFYLDQNNDYNMKITWYHCGNVNDHALQTYINPFDHDVVKFLNNIMNQTWKKTHDLESRKDHVQNSGNHFHNVDSDEDMNESVNPKEEVSQDEDIEMTDVNIDCKQGNEIPDLEPLPRHWKRRQ